MRSMLVLALASCAPAIASIDGADVRSPERLQALLARYDSMAPGAARDQLALAIDQVAGQRYATASRLYWYTDLAEAQRVAQAQHRPILALRMLGRLDEDLSCANSRLFRTTLYANTQVSAFLRDHFVLYWSSERPVPRVTIDFGDGRKLERTTTGNSAHYVLDEHARLVDVLPGLYAPAVFRAELATSARLATQLRTLGEPERAAALAAHHKAEWQRDVDRFAKVAGLQFVRGRQRILGPDEIGPSAVERAQRATMAKMAIEVPELGKIGIDAGSVPADDVAAWAAIGQQLWGIQGEAPGGRRSSARRREGSPSDDAPPPRQAAPPTIDRAPVGAKQGSATPLPVTRLLDPASLALVRQLHETGPVPVAPAATAAMIARLEQHILADTALNQLSLRAQIRAELMRDPRRPWTAVNAWIYASVFHTPATDPWLGLLPRTDFTGLPGDGVVMR